MVGLAGRSAGLGRRNRPTGLPRFGVDAVIVGPLYLIVGVAVCLVLVRYANGLKLLLCGYVCVVRYLVLLI